MKRLVILGLLLGNSWSTPSHASFFTGNKLLEACDQSKAECTGYVLGAVDMIMFNQTIDGAKQYLCIPSTVDALQITDVVLKYIRDNPEWRHWPSGPLIWNATTKAFPCNSAAKP